MISLTFRSYGPLSNALAGRSLVFTSCWVMVDPPRSLPFSVSMAAETKPAGSKPVFSQNVWSSTAVVASISCQGIWSKVTSTRRSVPRLASRTPPVRS